MAKPSKKKLLAGLAIGSPERVAAHARWQKSRGRRPSMGYRGVGNPRMALVLAEYEINYKQVVVPPEGMAFQ